VVSDTFLVLTGAVCLVVALIQAWLLVARFASDEGPVARIIPGKQDLLRSHIDYLMMAQFLFVFFALYRYFAIVPPVWLLVAICLGSFFNPFAFFVRALRPQYLTSPPPAFMAMITLSCVLTTIGYGATAWLLAEAALQR
jgi:hypothetical protein